MEAKLTLWGMRVVGCVFVCAAILKTLDSSSTEGRVTVFQYFVGASGALYWLFLGVESLVGCWLLFGWNVRRAAIVAAVMLGAMSGPVLRELFRPNPKACGCFGAAAASLLGNNNRVELGVAVLRN